MQTTAVEWNAALMKRDQVELGWNDSELAKRAGCHQTTISRFFAGRRTAKVGRAIADALGHEPSRYLPPVPGAPKPQPAPSENDTQLALPMRRESDRVVA